MTHPLAALIAGVKVKPLVWEDSSARHRIVIETKSSAGVYRITQRYYPEEMFTLEKANGDAVNLPTLDAAKAAAQADYEARILAALEAAHHVNETPKSEHDGDNVLTVPDLVEAGKVLEGVTPLVGWLRNPWSKSDSVERGPIPEWLVALLFEAAGKIEASSDLITALIALCQAQAAQIAGLEAKARESAMQELASLGQAQEAYEAQLAAEAKVAELEAQVVAEKEENRWAYVQAAMDDRQTDAEAATLRDEVERLRGATKIIQKRIDTIIAEEGSQEWDTGEVNLPEWAQTAVEELEGILAALEGKA